MQSIAASTTTLNFNYIFCNKADPTYWLIIQELHSRSVELLFILLACEMIANSNHSTLANIDTKEIYYDNLKSAKEDVLSFKIHERKIISTATTKEYQSQAQKALARIVLELSWLKIGITKAQYTDNREQYNIKWRECNMELMLYEDILVAMKQSTQATSTIYSQMLITHAHQTIVNDEGLNYTHSDLWQQHDRSALINIKKMVALARLVELAEYVDAQYLGEITNYCLSYDYALFGTRELLMHYQQKYIARNDASRQNLLHIIINRQSILKAEVDLCTHKYTTHP